MTGAAAFVIVAFFVSPQLQAADDSRWTVSLGVVHTDNIERSPANERSALIPEASVAFGYTKKRERFDAKIAANLLYSAYEKKYYRNVASPEPTSGTASVALTAAVIPGRFDWDFKDTFGHSPVNLAAADSPTNRQTTNVLETGPRIMFPIGERTQMQVGATYFSSRFGTSAADGTGYQGNVGLIRRTSRNGSLSLRLSGNRVEYPSSTIAKIFEVRSAFFSWNRVSTRGDLLLDLGQTELRGGGQTQNSPLLHLTYTRRLSPRSSVSFSAGREFSNAGQAFQGNSAFFGVATSLNDVQASAEAFRSDFGMATWNVTGERLDLSLQALARRETHPLGSTQDAQYYSAGLTLSRALSSRLRAGFRMEFGHRELTFLNAQNDQITVTANATFRLSSVVSLNFGLEHLTGDALGVGRNFVENRQLLSISYSPAPPR